MRQQPAPRGRVRREMPAPRAGAMGALSGLVVESAVTGTTGALTGLMARCVLPVARPAAGTRQCPDDGHVTTGDGRSVTVTSAQAGEAERLLRLALEARRHPMARHPLPGLQRAGAAAPAGRRATASAPPGGPCPTCPPAAAHPGP
ncbi:effector-associated constant component EACC1, partial [Streptomyces luteocolor]|uniref:effector-associated constant component EACC1 n=1 Tax=Streptomyces luteocolor TaxID=285500 RepID=UPI003F75E38C